MGREENKTSERAKKERSRSIVYPVPPSLFE